eukprot:5085978-Alexandrium_andersonii.AAC.1
MCVRMQAEFQHESCSTGEQKLSRVHFQWEPQQLCRTGASWCQRLPQWPVNLDPSRPANVERLHSACCGPRPGLTSAELG